MKIVGYELGGLARGKVMIPRGQSAITLEVQAYPATFEPDALFPLPKAPIKPIQYRSGRAVRDKNGRLELDYDEDDPAYKRELRRLLPLRTAYLVYHAVKDCGQVNFETAGDDTKPEFFESIFSELVQAGFSVGDLNLIVEGAQRVSNLDKDAVEDAKENFIQPEPDVQDEA